METKKKDVKRIESVAVLLAGIFVPTIFFLLSAFCFGFSFEENDDRFISEILSGALTGKNSFHTIYNNFWITFPISLLYRAFKKIPWWGLFLVFVNALSFGSMLYFMLRKCVHSAESAKKKIILSTGVTLGLLLLYFSEYRVTGSVQYTSVAIPTALSGYICLIFGEGAIASYVLFFFLELIAYCLRGNGMELVQPMGLLLFAGMFIVNMRSKKEDEKAKEKRKRLFTPVIFVCIALFSVVALGILGKGLAGEYKAKWRIFDSFNRMRTEFYDYGADGSYDGVKEILDSYNVSKTDWEAFLDYHTVNWPENEALNLELTAYAKEHTKKNTPKEIFKEFINKSVLRGEARPVLVLWAAAILLVLLSGKLSCLWPLLGIFASRCVSWAYLVYGGRVLDRVSIPLLLAEEISLYAVIVSVICTHFLKEKSAGKKELIKIIALGACFVLFAAFSLRTGRNQVKISREEFKTQQILFDSFKQVEYYCNSRPEECFILDINSFTSVHGIVFTEPLHSDVNYRMSGGWFAAAPGYRESMGEYLKKSPDFSFIVFDFGPEWSRIEHGTANYYRELTGYEPVLTDRIDVSSGGTFLVYRYCAPEEKQ